MVPEVHIWFNTRYMHMLRLVIAECVRRNRGYLLGLYVRKF